MKARGWKNMFLTVGSIGVLTVPAAAEPPACVYQDRCTTAGQLTCGGNCYCRADWKYAPPDFPQDNWEPDSSCGNYPDLSSEATEVKHSNTGFCNIGAGVRCSTNCDCPGCTNCTDPETFCCLSFEQYLILEVTSETIGPLDVATRSTPATTDRLNLYIESEVGGNTLQSADLYLDAFYGPIVLKVQDGATLKTY